MIQVLYFASLREAVGIAAEQVPADGLATVAELRARLGARPGAWPAALGDGARIMVAVNQQMARPATPIHDGDEVAFFPPVTGG